MPRYILLTPVFGSLPSCPSGRKLGTGTAIADTIGNAIAGDVVWAAFAASPSPVNCRPLDAAASAIMGLPITTLQAIATNNPVGNGVCLDAGD